MRPKNGLPDRAFSASAQSSASVRSEAFVRGGRIWPGCAAGRASRGERPARSGCGRSRSRDTRVRRSRAGAACCSRRRRNSRRCPRPRRPASWRQARQIVRAVDYVPRQGRDFLLDRWETPGAGRVGPTVAVGGRLCGRSGGHEDEHDRGQERARHSAADVMIWSCAAVSHPGAGDEVVGALPARRCWRSLLAATPAAPPSCGGTACK